MNLMTILIFTAFSIFIHIKAEQGSSDTYDKPESALLVPIAKDNHRSRQHIQPIIEQTYGYKSPDEILDKLVYVYNAYIKPLEEAYKFRHSDRNTLSANQILAKPMILLVGPWSVGKSTMINYLLDIQEESHLLYTGAEPTTTDFTVIMHGNNYKTVEGMVLAADKTKQFTGLEYYGKMFLEKLQGIEMPIPLLKQVTFVDTPGIIENRRQQERGYQYNEIIRWFVEQADLVFVVFDPHKLDVGTEVVSLFKQLKGKESQIRIILNKADTLDQQELMRIYGALFWNLAPLLNVTEPPRVYTGSFWQNKFKAGVNVELFQAEEQSLLQDMNNIIYNKIENKIAMVRQHAIQVKIHALLVDQYISAYQKNKYSSIMSYIISNEAIENEIIKDPVKHDIWKNVLINIQLSKYDMPSVKSFKQFFNDKRIEEFTPITCSWGGLAGNCRLLGYIQEAIDSILPGLLKQHQMYFNSYCDSNKHQCK